jgi:hypothetical protein
MQELIDEIVKKLIKEIKGPTRVDLLIALKDLLYIVVEIQRKERVLN